MRKETDNEEACSKCKAEIACDCEGSLWTTRDELQQRFDLNEEAFMDGVPEPYPDLEAALKRAGFDMGADLDPVNGGVAPNEGGPL